MQYRLLNISLQSLAVPQILFLQALATSPAHCDRQDHLSVQYSRSCCKHSEAVPVTLRALVASTALPAQQQQ
jgi:hypothetical protein